MNEEFNHFQLIRSLNSFFQSMADESRFIDLVEVLIIDSLSESKAFNLRAEVLKIRGAILLLLVLVPLLIRRGMFGTLN